jgi:hypothetical protein
MWHLYPAGVFIETGLHDRGALLLFILKTRRHDLLAWGIAVFTL